MHRIALGDGYRAPNDSKTYGLNHKDWTQNQWNIFKHNVLII